MEDATNFLGDLPLAPEIGGHGIHRSSDAGVLKRELIEADDVLEVNPGEPLPAIAQRATHEQPKWQRQQAERERIAAEDHRRANPNDPDTEWFRLLRRGFPLLAEPGEKRIAGMALLRDRLVAAVPVVVDPRRTDEYRRPTFGGRALERLHQRGGRRQAAGNELRHPPARPWPAANARAGEGDDALRARQFLHPVAVRGAPIPGQIANPAGRIRRLRSPAQDDHVMAAFHQLGHQPGADQARSTADQDFHPLTILRQAGRQGDRAAARSRGHQGLKLRVRRSVRACCRLSSASASSETRSSRPRSLAATPVSTARRTMSPFGLAAKGCSSRIMRSRSACRTAIARSASGMTRQNWPSFMRARVFTLRVFERMTATNSRRIRLSPLSPYLPRRTSNASISNSTTARSWLWREARLISFSRSSSRNAWLYAPDCGSSRASFSAWISLRPIISAYRPSPTKLSSAASGSSRSSRGRSKPTTMAPKVPRPFCSVMGTPTMLPSLTTSSVKYRDQALFEMSGTLTLRSACLTHSAIPSSHPRSASTRWSGAGWSEPEARSAPLSSSNSTRP